MNFPLFENAVEAANGNLGLAIAHIRAKELAGTGVGTPLYLCKLYKHRKDAARAGNTLIMSDPTTLKLSISFSVLNNNFIRKWCT